MSNSIKIGLHGANGRMGQAITARAINYGDEFSITAQQSSKDNSYSLSEFCNKAQIIIDFSSPTNFDELIDCCTVQQKNMVIGTTGLSTNQHKKMQQAAKHIAIIYSANMSIGINIILEWISKLSIINDNTFDINIIDYHHKFKKDSPSGTALMIGDAIRTGQNSSRAKNNNEISFSSIRAGGIYGEHDIIFANHSEVLTIKHQALNRDLFADGALRAARWIKNHNKGLYTMQDVIKSYL